MKKREPKIFTVVATSNLTPNMIRVTFTAPSIGFLDSGCHGANCKLFLPELGQARDEFEEQLKAGPRPTVRTYTVRQVRKELQEMDIDFVYHGDTGPASAWAKLALPGAFCGFAGPGPVKVPEFYADRYLVVADMSALPVAAATLEAMPDDAKGVAFFDILSKDDRQNFHVPEGIECHWIVNPVSNIPNDNILHRVSELDWRDYRVQTCIAGESGMIKTLRQEIIGDWGLPKDDCYISGYWKIGLVEDEHQQLKRKEAAAI